MVFSSFEFLLYFLPAFLLIYFLLPAKCKNMVILLGSLIFYYYGVKDKPVYLVLMLLTVIVNYFAAGVMDICKRDVFRKGWMIVGMIWNIGNLFAFKYLDFMTENLNRVLNLTNAEWRLPCAELILPIGISFYTFQISSYLLDVYRKKIPAERSLLTLGTYLCMFPQLIAGPIVTYAQVREQLWIRVHSWDNVEEGFREFTIGLALKVLIANRVGSLWSQVQTIGFESISTPLAWLGIAAFSFQIYFDFYGYSLMAKGLGCVMGFAFPDNFNQPYLAKTMTEFWRRWHITLGSWFREYVYIPLGGNRKNHYWNLFLVWMLTGLWHGASWNFILWGCFLFLVVSVEKLGFGKMMEKLPLIGHLYMMLLIPISWLIFAVSDPWQIVVYLGNLFPLQGQAASAFVGDFLKYGKMYAVPLLAAFVCSTGIPRKIYEAKKYTFFMTVMLVVLFWGCMYCMYMGMDDPFLYYQF
ncbi:MAG: MBOAT family protein [Lachnospiraceae bacterium]|nr:MBOAT family protein [Lachnospiraceae bacterium]